MAKQITRLDREKMPRRRLTKKEKELIAELNALNRTVADWVFAQFIYTHRTTIIEAFRRK